MPVASVLTTSRALPFAERNSFVFRSAAMIVAQQEVSWYFVMRSLPIPDSKQLLHTGPYFAIGQEATTIGIPMLKMPKSMARENETIRYFVVLIMLVQVTRISLGMFPPESCHKKLCKNRRFWGGSQPMEAILAFLTSAFSHPWEP